MQSSVQPHEPAQSTTRPRPVTGKVG